MNNTIEYYNNNAESYYNNTVNADFSGAYDQFLQYVPEHGSILDVGCGSGRDMATFASRGYHVIGLDASEHLADIASEHAGAPVIVDDMTAWIAEEPFDGVWCCASLLHLDDEGIRAFFCHLKDNLKSGGVIYASVKSGIATGIDDKGRYMRNFSKDELQQLFEDAGIRIVEYWETGDKLNREGFCWINTIGIKG